MGRPPPAFEQIKGLERVSLIPRGRVGRSTLIQSELVVGRPGAQHYASAEDGRSRTLNLRLDSPYAPVGLQQPVPSNKGVNRRWT